MKSTPVLVTAVCGDVGDSVARALNMAGHEVYGTDVKKYCAICSDLKAFRQVPPAGDSGYLEVLADICESYGINKILPISDAEIAYIDKNRAFFVQRHISVIINSSQALSVFSDKFKTVEYFKELGYLTPKTFFLKNYNNSLAFPLIIKIMSGCGSAGVGIAHCEEDIEYFQRKWPMDLLVQECVGDIEYEYTTGVFSDGRKVSSITFKRSLAKGGYSQEVYFEVSPFMEEMAKTLAKDLNLIGSINIQTRKVKEIHVPFEVNPRLSSTAMFRALAGFNDAHWWVNCLEGNSYSYSPLHKKFVGVRCLCETIFHE